METSSPFRAGISAAILATGISFAVAGTVVPASAIAEGFYLGAGTGQSSTDITCDLDISCNAKDTDTALKIFAGYQFNPNFGIEGGYYDLGKFSIDGNDSLFGVTRLAIEVSGLTLAAVGTIPLGERFRIFGKAGLFVWDADVSVESSTFGNGSLGEDGTDPLIGVGASFDLVRNLALRVEWERFLNIGDESSIGESDVDLISASLVLRF